jgi:GntR family transcriptional regulator, rspAB operon transcriptional repressor
MVFFFPHYDDFSLAVQNCYISMTVMRNAVSNAKLDRRTPMREQIYTLIRGLILTGKIKPGDAIDEKEIASLLKVSRTPVREAVKKLSDEHLVDVVAQSGTKASVLNAQDVHQAYIIRRALEMESAAHAAQNMSSEAADRLSDILRAQARAIENRSYAEAIERDDDFHRAIADISNLPRLWRTVEISKAQLDRCRHMMIPRSGEGEATLEQHREVIRALMSKDPARARTAMGDHLDKAYANAAKMLVALETSTPSDEP